MLIKTGHIRASNSQQSPVRTNENNVENVFNSSFSAEEELLESYNLKDEFNFRPFQ